MHKPLTGGAVVSAFELRQSDRRSPLLSNEEVLENLNSRKVWRGVQTLSINEPKRIMEVLGNPQDAVPSIIVAGTNGKGSVCSMLASILMSSGKKVAQFTSPHLQHYTERLLIQGKPIEESKFLSAIGNVIEKEEEHGLKLSYFELLIAASYLHCSIETLDWMVVEVGLGGRLDATNVIIRPRASVITSIGIDHTTVLGETEYLIAKEKAGIFRKDTPAFVGVVSEEARRSITEYSQTLGAKVDFLEKTPSLNPAIPQYKANNINLACQVANALGISSSHIEHGVSRAKWPGRLEEISVETDHGIQKVILDGAHNPDGVDGLIDYLNRRTESSFVLLISILWSKDYTTMLSALKNWAKNKPVTFIFSKMSYESAVDPELLSSQIEGSLMLDSCQASLVELKKRLHPGVLGVITGSLYFIGEVRGTLVSEPFTTLNISQPETSMEPTVSVEMRN